MRASFSLPCQTCESETRVVAETVAADVIGLEVFCSGCQCPDRPTKREAEQEAAEIFDRDLEGRWSVVVGRSEDL